jgi:hypothetical protein
MSSMRIAAAAGTLCIVGSFVSAQTQPTSLIGTWIAPSVYCGKSTVTVTAVEQNGIVRGTFMCERTGWNPVMGDKIDRNAVKGTLTGTHFVMENSDGGGFDLVIEGATAKGNGRARATMAPNPITYTKQ